MSVNRYNATTGELTSLATGSRTWVGTREAYDQAKQAGTLPNNCLIAITDDEKDHNHYSTEETATGMYWIDGKPIYRKVIDFGALPNNAHKDVNHGISNLGTVVNLYGMANQTNNHVPIPYVSPVTLDDQIQLGANDTFIRIRADNDKSAFTGIVVMEYTKTTD